MITTISIYRMNDICGNPGLDGPKHTHRDREKGKKLMPIMCIQCAMRALLNGEPTPTFDQTAHEHMAQYHPDPEAALKERGELEQRLEAKMKGDKP